MTRVEEIAAIAQQQTHQLGIAQFDIYGSTVDEASVQVDHGAPKQVKASTRASVTVRVWNEAGQVGVTSTSDLDPNGVELALKTAQEASEFGVTDHAPNFSPEAIQPLQIDVHQSAPTSPIEDLTQQLLAAEADLMGRHEAIASVPYNGLAQRQTARFYLNSGGALRQEAHAIHSIYLYSKTEQADRKPRSAGAYRLSHHLSDLDIPGCIQETAEKTISHLDYQPIATGTYRVVFSPEAFLSLLRAFSNLFNAQNILDKRSLSTPESLGTAIASDLLSIYDDATHPENVGQTSFDDEGTPTRRVELINQGTLTSFLHSAGTAKRMGAQPTGHANMGAKITVSPHFYHVLPGSGANPEFDLSQADNVVWIDDLQALHAGVKALQGSFSLPFDGWLLHQGERQSVESATVAGDFLTLLKSVVYVAPEAKITPSGICPQIWVDGLAITGEE
jgi:PmbA protein